MVEKLLHTLLDKLDNMLKYMKNRERSDIDEKICRYIMYMNSDIQALTIRMRDRTSVIWKVTDHMCEISAFIECQLIPNLAERKEEYEALREKFGELNAELAYRYAQEYDTEPACFKDWCRIARGE